MSDPAIVPSPLYGLRTWAVVGAPGAERLGAPQRDATWPTGGEWLEAHCPTGHAAPASGCECGVHAWHPRLRSARRALASRRHVAGVVEATGAVELHEDGFRAERARPYAIVDVPWRSGRVSRTLAEAYGVPLIEARRAADLVEWCRARDLGLDRSVVERMLGGAAIERRRRRSRVRALRAAAVLAVVAAMLATGLLLTDSPGDRKLSGRAGDVRQQER
jgi:hypothetical protein